MRLGSLLLNKFGMRNKYQGLFEKFLKLGIMGLGYEQPMKSDELERIALSKALAEIDKPVIFDVGANKGQYIDLIRAVTNSSFTYSFEPDRINFDVLTSKFSEMDDVSIFNMGLGERQETLSFYRHKQDDLSTFHYSDSNQLSNYRSKTVDKVVEVEVKTVDSFLVEHSINHVDFMKVDTEGHDYFVLKGAEESIKSKRIKNIQFEFSEMNIASKTTFFDFWNLLNEQYDLFRLCKDKHYKIEQYIPMIHEIYHPVNFLATVKD